MPEPDAAPTLLLTLTANVPDQAGPDLYDSALERIDTFRKQHFFLSNFSPVQIKLGGMIFASTEHAYMAAKADPEDREATFAYRRQVQACEKAGDAKRLGRTVRLRDGWDERDGQEPLKVEVMRALIRQKFGHAPLARQLLATGARQLVEGNRHGDTFWGECKGEGKNTLGLLLMQRRHALRH